MDEIPTISEFLQVAPIATLVVLIIGIGLWLGFKSRDGEVQSLKDWITELLKRK